MTQVSIPGGMMWPWTMPVDLASGGNGTIDAAGEKVSFIGRVYWDGRPSGAKTIDTTGSSKIGLQIGVSVFDNASSSVDIGIQGVDTSGPPARPDGTFSVKSVVTTAADTTPALTTGATMCFATPTTGTVSLTHGDLIAVVADLTARGGTDAINFPVHSSSFLRHFPVLNVYSGSWGSFSSNSVMPILVASDGTIGTLDGALFPIGERLDTAYADASNPDEYAMIFQVPWACKIDALWAYVNVSGGTSDFTVDLFSGAETTPVSLLPSAFTADAAQLGIASSRRLVQFNLPSEISLTAGVDYCVAIKATGAGNVNLSGMTMSDAAHRALYPAGTTVRSVTRNGGTGAFASSSTVIMYSMGVRISSFDNGAGSGGGLITHPGMTGGMRG